MTATGVRLAALMLQTAWALGALVNTHANEPTHEDCDEADFEFEKGAARRLKCTPEFRGRWKSSHGSTAEVPNLEFLQSRACVRDALSDRSVLSRRERGAMREMLCLLAGSLGLEALEAANRAVCGESA